MKKKKFDVKCFFCTKIILKKRIRLSKNGKNFCNVQCCYNHLKKGKITNCNYCNEEVYKSPSSLKNKNVFCSYSCSTAFKNKKGKVQNFIKPIEKYRKKALNFLPHRCNNEKCIIQKNNIKLETYLLDVDHLDKNRANNQLENLQFLCLYCHALKTRLIDSKKRKNKKNGGVSEN